MELMTLQQAAKELGVTERTVYRYVTSGKIPAQKTVTGRWRIKKDDIDAFNRGEIRTKTEEG